MALQQADAGSAGGVGGAGGSAGSAGAGGVASIDAGHDAEQPDAPIEPAAERDTGPDVWRSGPCPYECCGMDAGECNCWRLDSAHERACTESGGTCVTYPVRIAWCEIPR